jgi:hypothetical protein
VKKQESGDRSQETEFLSNQHSAVGGQGKTKMSVVRCQLFVAMTKLKLMEKGKAGTGNTYTHYH